MLFGVNLECERIKTSLLCAFKVLIRSRCLLFFHKYFIAVFISSRQMTYILWSPFTTDDQSTDLASKVTLSL